MSNWFYLREGQQEDCRVLYKDARVIDPFSKKDFMGYIITNGKIIEDFGEKYLDEDNFLGQVLDCEGKLLIPGIIDIHVHLREPGQTKKETIETGTKSAAAGGVTTVVCQPNTEPKISTVEILEYVKKRSLETGYVNVLSYATITGEDGTVNDIQSLYEHGAVGFTDDGLPVMDSAVMKNSFSLAAEIGVPIAQHAEDLYLSAKGCINKGEVSDGLNVKGMPEESESVMVARDIILMQNTKAKYHVLHVSSKQTVDIIRQAKAEGMNVTCEVTPHHLHLNHSAVKDFCTLAKINPPLRNEESRISLVKALKEGVIDVIASDHAPHEDHTKHDIPLSQASFGMVGLETILPLSLELYHSGEMSLFDVLAKLTCNPAKIINIKSGRIEKGYFADLVILDLDKQYTIKTKDFSSKSKNSPFNNRKVKGKVLKTIVKGKVVYSL